MAKRKNKKIIVKRNRLEVLVYLNKTENTHTEFYRIL